MIMIIIVQLKHVDINIYEKVSLSCKDALPTLLQFSGFSKLSNRSILLQFKTHQYTFRGLPMNIIIKLRASPSDDDLTL